MSTRQPTIASRTQTIHLLLACLPALLACGGSSPGSTPEQTADAGLVSDGGSDGVDDADGATVDASGAGDGAQPDAEPPLQLPEELQGVDLSDPSAATPDLTAQQLVPGLRTVSQAGGLLPQRSGGARSGERQLLPRGSR